MGGGGVTHNYSCQCQSPDREHNNRSSWDATSRDPAVDCWVRADVSASETDWSPSTESVSLLSVFPREVKDQGSRRFIIYQDTKKMTWNYLLSNVSISLINSLASFWQLFLTFLLNDRKSHVHIINYYVNMWLSKINTNIISIYFSLPNINAVSSDCTQILFSS